MESLIKILAIVLLVAFAGLGINNLNHTHQKLQLEQIELKSTSTKLKELNLRYNRLDQQLDNSQKLNDKQVKQLEDEKSKLEQEKSDLEQQLQAKAAAKQKLASAQSNLVNAITGASTAYAESGIDCSSQTTSKAFIYCHESGNVADKWNGSGCYGLGQDCNNIVYNRCKSDYACQDQYFTEYMQRRYGSWDAAKAHWLARVPINGKDVGNWW